MPPTDAPTRYLATLALMLSLAIVAGCAKDDKGGLEPFDPNEPVKLKIMFSDRDYFYQKYGKLLGQKFPNIEFEVLAAPRSLEGVTTPEDLLNQARGEEPDILKFSSPLYEKLAAEGRLLDLGPLVRQDRFDLDEIHATVLESLKNGGDGKLFGLAPEFIPSALYYNADLFRRFGVEPPKDRTSWEDVLKLAMRFASEGDDKTRVYGYQAGGGLDLAGFLLSIGETNGLSPVSADGRTFVMGSPRWRELAEKTLQASGSLLTAKGDTMLERLRSSLFSTQDDPFLQGRVAMKLASFGYYLEFERAQQQMPGFKPFEWNVVTLPVDPLKPDSTEPLFLSEIYSVNAKSAHQRAAWEVVKWINGEDIAKLESRTQRHTLSTRKTYAQQTEGLNVEPFFALKPELGKWSEDTVPEGFQASFHAILSRELSLVQTNKKTLDEAFEAIQSEGRQVLAEAWAKKNAGDGK